MQFQRVENRLETESMFYRTEFCETAWQIAYFRAFFIILRFISLKYSFSNKKRISLNLSTFLFSPFSHRCATKYLFRFYDRMHLRWNCPEATILIWCFRKMRFSLLFACSWPSTLSLLKCEWTRSTSQFSDFIFFLRFGDDKFLKTKSLPLK